MTKKIVLVVGAFALMVTSCNKIQPPHVAVHCKVKFDACMVKNTFEGPLKAHKICMRKRSSKCR
ncbi:MAG: hypothetical protein KAG56_11095 [Sulfurovaceae bacterium]|nr:hypothetical protein [Sulfurovaceae bacterium]